MATPDLERIAFTVECYLNALSLDDGPARTTIEEKLVRWLVRPVRRQDDCLIYRKSGVECFSGGKMMQRVELPEVTQARTLWCDGNTLSAIDGAEQSSTGKLVMLGTAGLALALALPGMAMASDGSRKKQGDGGGGNSNNNNNNNNNNNG